MVKWSKSLKEDLKFWINLFTSVLFGDLCFVHWNSHVFYTEIFMLQILGTAPYNIVAPATRHPGFVHPCLLCIVKTLTKWIYAASGKLCSFDNIIP
jgi:hypothetical protein